MTFYRTELCVGERKSVPAGGQLRCEYHNNGRE